MTLQDDINEINNWAESWLVKFNPAKSESLVISRKTSKPVHPNLNMSNTPIQNVKTHKHLYFSFVRPILEYGDVVWNNMPQYLKDGLDKIQNEAARIVSGCSKLVSLSDLREEGGWELLSERRRKHKLILFFTMVKGFAPIYLSNLVPQLNSDISTCNYKKILMQNINGAANQLFLK